MSPKITTLTQQSATFKKTYKCPDRCPTCGRYALVGHGVYYRVDRESGDRYPIPRFSCQSCHATCSVLPEYIAPRQWYGWILQQQALLLHIAGKSLRAITEVLSPAARTVTRWIKRFNNQFLLQGYVSYGLIWVAHLALEDSGKHACKNSLWHRLCVFAIWPT
jgi:transposase-like protein